MSEVFSAVPIGVSVLIGAGGAVLALIVRLAKGDGTRSLWRMLETLLTGALGAFLAHAFVYLMISAGGHSKTVVTLTSLFFFIWPGLVNVVTHLITGHPVIGESGVLWIALVAGGFVGVMDGLWATHRWLGIGPVAFLLDITWGLGGSTNGLLLHVYDTVAGKHADGPTNTRHESHRYEGGFRIKADYIFTQGAVMSNATQAPPGSPLFHHETLHTWQNRILGPFYWMSYVSWMIVTFIPALIVGAATGKAADVIQWWTYYNNTWEVMAYGVADPHDRDGWPPSRVTGWMCWPWALVVTVNVLATVGFGALFVVAFSSAYG